MVQKLDYYDLLGVIVPGVLMTCWVIMCFQNLQELVGSVALPSAFTVIALTAAAFFVGQLVQAVASLCEPLLYRSWGGRPSDFALQRGLGRYLPKATADRIAAKLSAALPPNSDEHSKFLYAMQRTDSAGIGRASRFNSLYAYHRGLCVLIGLSLLVFIASLLWGSATELAGGTRWGIVAVLVVILVLTWHRARQRGYYYVREVLLTAERLLDDLDLERSP